jgi:hypothetical protein
MPKRIIDCFILQVNESKNKIENKIENFRVDKDIRSLLLFVKSNIEELVKSSSYVLGYTHGMNIDIEKSYPKLDALIKESYFYYTWNYLDDVLKNMRDSYPHDWEEDVIYENLMYGFDKLYSRMGVKLSENDKYELFFELPQRG